MGSRIVTGSVTLIPSGNTGITNMSTSTSSSYKIDNAYTDETSTSYARLSITQNRTGYVYFTFAAPSIPSNATITSISGKAKLYVSSTTRVSSTRCQLYSGTSEKGSNVTFASTTATTVNLSPGTVSSWNVSDLSDLRLYIGGTASNSSSSRYIYFYGCSVTIEYSYTETTYDISVSNSTSATVTADSSVVVEGKDAVIHADTVTGIVIKDNGTDVTNQFAQGTSGTVSSYPASYNTGGSINGTNYQSTIGKGSDTSSRTGNDYFSTTQGGSGSTWIDYFFDFSSIPEGSDITSVAVSIKGHCEDSSQSREIANVQLYSGTTAKGSGLDITSNSDKVYNLTPGTWTREELQNAKLRFTIGVYGGLISGATWTVAYEQNGYIYIITNVTGDHVIVVTSSGGETQTIYVKVNGAWVATTSVYKKVSGSWVLQTNLSNVFDSGTNYVKG